MKNRVAIAIVLPMLFVAGSAMPQERILDIAANKVIGKYQSASCEQLWAKRGQPKTPEQMRVLQFLRNDPTARAEFLNKVAGPIANKMFECGMLP